jgi:hypothetical protein
LKQSDRCAAHGLLDFMNKYNAYRKANDGLDFSKPSHKTHHAYDIANEKWCGSSIGIEMVEMSHKDIERSPIVAKILDIYKPLYISNAENVSQLPLKSPPNDDILSEKLGKQPKKTDDVDADVVIDVAVRNVSIIEYGSNISNSTDTTDNTSYLKKNHGSDDAALIPISHMSKKYGGL